MTLQASVEIGCPGPRNTGTGGRHSRTTGGSTTASGLPIDQEPKNVTVADEIRTELRLHKA